MSNPSTNKPTPDPECCSSNVDPSTITEEEAMLMIATYFEAVARQAEGLDITRIPRKDISEESIKKARAAVASIARRAADPAL